MSWNFDKLGIYVQDKDLGKISYPEQANEDFFQIEDKSVWFSQRNDMILELFKNYPIEGDFLDVGGGNGYQSLAIQKHHKDGHVILCEPGYIGCENARKRDVKLVYNSVYQDFPFSEYNIKGVGLFDVLEHIENDVEFLNELYELLPKGAHVYITVPGMKKLWSEIDPLSGHYRRYNKKEVRRLKENVKFKFVTSGYYFSFYVLPMVLLRIIPYRLGIRKGYKKLIEKEKKNHNNDDGFIGNYLNKRHARLLTKIANNKTGVWGTSMYMVLKK